MAAGGAGEVLMPKTHSKSKAKNARRVQKARAGNALKKALASAMRRYTKRERFKGN